MSSSSRTPGAPPAARAGTITLGGEVVVNRMGVGAMRITGPGIFGPPADLAEAKRVLRRAVELGVDFIDTADSYGPFVSEDLIAEALRPYPDGLVIATKGGFERPGPGRWVENGRPEHLRRALEGSLRRLHLERIDLWQLHRVDPEVPADEQFDALAAFVREGLVRLVGLSEVGIEQIEQARRFVPIASVQNRYNLMDREWEAVLRYAEREDIAFIPWYPLGAGSLGDDAEPRAARARLERVARRHGATPMQIALAWLLDRSPAMLPIPGTSRVAHLEENLAAAAIGLDDDDRRLLETAR
ncbi:MAG: aldo/keto reductase [Gemmatimonadetes bacterium]|nr:aldo/keto reductase [Gemmatimonadota bacterium]